ncbi:peptidoglycan-binding protein [Nocardioides panacis]|uniref:Peptidoglycan-binding protein n=1 Tax=Nocardioides panacis TaxID=2849501 RepID=A0A975XZR4_9ACTN|nr:peptidoglycan-binding protein [Nocardioides panacis]QWZ07685.1 peptidoglycan-binding protein [Nocardioides panacis]
MSDLETAPTPTPTAPLYRVGDRGRAVSEIRSRLGLLGLTDPDGGRHTDPDTFDESLDRAVRAFQQMRGLAIDGIVGPSTYRVLEEARWRLGDRLLTHVPGNLSAGDDVLALQQRLLDLGFKVGKLDGRFGHQTEQAVRDFQRNVGVPADGTCGPATLKSLSRLAPIVRGGSPNAMRAEERIRREGPQLTGKIVVIDPSVGRFADSAMRLHADAITTDLARRIEGRLVATGVQAFLTNTGGASEATEVERAEFANRTDAHLCISLQVDGSENPDAAGCSTYYYGSEAHGVASSAGERFAGLVQREIVARTDLGDLRSHGKTFDILRRTKMPAVRIDAGYLTNPGDAARLADPSFRDVIAEAVVVAVQRVYLDAESDSKTGVLRLGELRAALRHHRP